MATFGHALPTENYSVDGLGKEGWGKIGTVFGGALPLGASSREVRVEIHCHVHRSACVYYA